MSLLVEEPPVFTATMTSDGGLVVQGRLDSTCVAALVAALDQALLERPGVLTIDASDVEFIDTVALGELLSYSLHALALGTQLRLGAASPFVEEVIDRFDLGAVLRPGPMPLKERDDQLPL